MEWFFIGVLAQFFWAVTNFIDKTLIEKYFKSGIGAMVIYSCFIGLPAAALIMIFKPSVLSINPLTAVFIILNSFLLILYLFPYLKALGKSDASLVIPMYQMIAIFGYFLAFFVLGERLSGVQIGASLVIIFAAVGISMRFVDGRMSFHWRVFFLMTLASFLIALNALLFKFFAVELDFWTVSFWSYFGFFIMGVLFFLFTKSYRRDFLSSFGKNSGTLISWNVVNEVLNIAALMIFSYATLLAPLSLVLVTNGFQPVFVFLIGIFLSVFYPHVIREDIRKRILAQKIVFILIMLVGAYFLNVG